MFKKNKKIKNKKDQNTRGHASARALLLRAQARTGLTQFTSSDFVE